MKSKIIQTSFSLESMRESSKKKMKMKKDNLIVNNKIRGRKNRNKEITIIERR